jgi:signal transduction histidine kinase
VAKVTLRQVSDMLEVAVRDDGAGFDPATEKGLGLLGMEERVRRLKGSFHLESAPGKGTAVLVRLPVPAGLTDSERLESVSS